MRQPAQTYRQFSVQGATPLGLVVMLYDGAITFMQGAVSAIEAHDIERKCDYLKRAQAIILQLEGCLDFRQGGEVAETLKALYMHARTQMLQVNLDNSPQILRSLIEQFITVRDAWREAERRLANQNTSLPAEYTTAEKNWSGAETMGLSIFD